MHSSEIRKYLKKSLFSAGLVLRNVGFQFNGYNSIDPSQKQELLPIDLQIAVSQKLPKAPLRFHLTLHNMQTWDLSYRLRKKYIISHDHLL